MTQLSMEKELFQRDLGMARAARSNNPLLEEARMVAERFALGNYGFEKYLKHPANFADPNNLCTIDDVRAHMGLKEGKRPHRWLGSVFKIREDWVYVDQINSETKGNHARPISVWRYIGRKINSSAAGLNKR